MRCSLCGFEFSPEDATCKGCPMNRGCKVICCPHCGYQMIGDSNVMRWIKRLFKGEERDGAVKRDAR